MRKSGFSFFSCRRHADALRSQVLRSLFLVSALIFVAPNGFAQEAYRTPGAPESPAEAPPETAAVSPSELKKLPLEQLVDIEITSASRRPAKLSETSRAGGVIT